MPDLDSLLSETLSHQFAEGQYTDYATDKLNEAQQYVVAQTQFRDFFTQSNTTLAAGTEELSLPTDFSQFYSLVCVGSPNITLRQITPADYDALDSDATGRPYLYDVSGDTMSVYPTPDASYDIQLRYWRKPVDLELGTDVPEIPGQYHHLLVSYALIKCFERENDYEAAMYHQQRFDTDMVKCRGEVEYDSRDKTGPKRIAGTWKVSEPTLTAWRP